MSGRPPKNERRECNHPVSELRDVVGQPEAKYCPKCYEILSGVNMRR